MRGATEREGEGEGWGSHRRRLGPAGVGVPWVEVVGEDGERGAPDLVRVGVRVRVTCFLCFLARSRTSAVGSEPCERSAMMGQRQCASSSTALRSSGRESMYRLPMVLAMYLVSVRVRVRVGVGVSVRVGRRVCVSVRVGG